MVDPMASIGVAPSARTPGVVSTAADAEHPEGARSRTDRDDTYDLAASTARRAQPSTASSGNQMPSASVDPGRNELGRFDGEDRGLS